MCTCLLTHGCLPPRKKTQVNLCENHMLLVDEHVRLIDSYLFSRIILEDILDFNLKLYFTLANLSIRKRIFYIHNFGQQVMTLVNIPFFDVLGKTNC